MPPDQQHPQYAAVAPLWRKCRDAAAGQEAVHAAGPLYLPPLSGQSPAEYRAYRDRALFFNACGRTIDGLSGLVFRRPPYLRHPPGMAPFVADVNGLGCGLQGLAEQLVQEVLEVGRAGILVDYTPAGQGPQLAGEPGPRPVWTLYRAEDILDWRTQTRAGRQVLSQVRLAEQASQPHPQDEFRSTSAPRIRVLELVPAPDGQTPPLYRQRLFEPQGSGGWRLASTITPRRHGRPLDFIPFVFCGQRDTTPQVDKPPLLDLVNLNLSHYQLMADFRHGLHFTGLPTPVVSGYLPEAGEELRIGSSTAWVFPDPEARATFLEFSGQGLGAMKEELAALEARMALMGSRILAPEGRQVETAQTATIHRAGEASVMASLALALSSALDAALAITRDWGSWQGAVSCALNRDFMPQPLNASELTALVGALQGGAISQRVFMYALRQGELYPPDWSDEDELAHLAKEAQP